MAKKRAGGAVESVGERRKQNTLFHGDNLAILRRYVDDNSVDLVYLDPPFQSGKDYNLLFKREDGSRPAAQIRAFTDTWRWDQAAKAAYDEILTTGGEIGLVLESIQKVVADTPMLAYLSMMALRLVELYRVLKPTGSLYLHCDPTASHYLKMLLDSVFGGENFRNEIVWKRSSAHSDTGQGARHYGRVTDTLLFYARSSQNTWNQQYAPYDPQYIAENYHRKDPDGRLYRIDNIQGPGGEAKGNPYYEVLGVKRHWRYSRERMDELIKQGRIIQTRPGAVPQYKRYLDEMPGVPVQNLWTDIKVINNRSKEALGYPTQKPLSLLERIITTSSNEGDVLLDPFCGCGTAIHAAQKLKRRWIGIDIAKQAIDIIEDRLAREEHFGEIVKQMYELVREPEDLDGARALALQDRHQFEKWAVRLVGADSDEKLKGADKGIDGVLQFRDAPGSPIRKIIISVKSGGVSVRDVRDLRGTIEREGAAIGVLITLNAQTKPMRAEAASAGSYHTTHAHQSERYPRLQLLTVEQLLEGDGIRAPVTFVRRGPMRKTPQIEFSFTAAKSS